MKWLTPPIAFQPLASKEEVANIRFGLTTLGGLWKKYQTELPQNLAINPIVYPSPELINEIKNLTYPSILKYKDTLIAQPFNSSQTDLFIESGAEIKVFQSFTDILQFNATQIIKDCQYIIKGHDEDYRHIDDNILQHESAVVQPGFFNTDEGPIYIGKNVTIMEGCMIKGPVAILEGSVIKMGAKLYPGTTIGRYCTIGGEVKNSIIHDYSNKSHDGYLGDSILGQWNNFGANTNVSNVALSFGPIQTVNWEDQQLKKLPTIKMGVVTGDFVKTAINSTIYSGCKIGSFTSLATLHPITGNIPPFTWWTFDTKAFYQPDLLKKHMKRQMTLKNIPWQSHWDEKITRLLNSIQQ